jgi:hypothetical protein
MIQAYEHYYSGGVVTYRSYEEAIDDAPESRGFVEVEDIHPADEEPEEYENTSWAPAGHIFVGMRTEDSIEAEYWAEPDEYREWAGMEWNGAAWL